MFVFNKSYLDRLDDKYRELFGDGEEVYLDETQLNELRKVKVPIKTVTIGVYYNDFSLKIQNYTGDEYYQNYRNILDIAFQTGNLNGISKIYKEIIELIKAEEEQALILIEVE